MTKFILKNNKKRGKIYIVGDHYKDLIKKYNEKDANITTSDYLRSIEALDMMKARDILKLPQEVRYPIFKNDPTLEYVGFVFEDIIEKFQQQKQVKDYLSEILDDFRAILPYNRDMDSYKKYSEIEKLFDELLPQYGYNYRQFMKPKIFSCRHELRDFYTDDIIYYSIHTLKTRQEYESYKLGYYWDGLVVNFKDCSKDYQIPNVCYCYSITINEQEEYLFRCDIKNGIKQIVYLAQQCYDNYGNISILKDWEQLPINKQIIIIKALVDFDENINLTHLLKRMRTKIKDDLQSLKNN